MVQTVYTNYWQNRLSGVKKEHGSYKTEEEAIDGIKAWWDLHKENYPHAEHIRTQSGALEIVYKDSDHFYRIEKHEIEGKLPSRSYKVKSRGEIESLRKKYNLNEASYLFDELAEPYRDRLIIAMADSKKVRQYIYDQDGSPIREIPER
ncbi:hypothetical protein [Lacticigenium naphthae]|uniref:hypothetical protein n=1 Tax=Lacticigenium naphthae TaxID=515351 RepID=UPI0004014D3D|nr:hypothetical protein [Lacticigenium naphthae]